MKLSNTTKFGLAALLLVVAIGMLARSLWIIHNNTELEDFQTSLREQLEYEVSMATGMYPTEGYDGMVIQNSVKTEYNFDNTFNGMALMVRPKGTEAMVMLDMSTATVRIIVEQGDNGACTRLEIKTTRGNLVSECVLGSVQHK